MKKLLLIASLVAGTAFAQGDSIAPFTLQRDMGCGDFYTLVENLSSKYGENAAMKFLKKGSDGDVLVVVFINFENGTSTIVETTRDGISCILTKGENMAVTSN